MAFGEIISLVDLIRSLAGRKVELNERYFRNFIEPAWKSFVRVHEDYKSSLERYAHFLLGQSPDVGDLLKQISHDSMFSEDMRTELLHLVRNIPPTLLKTKSRLLHDFMYAMLAYFGDRRTLHFSEHEDELSMMMGKTVEIETTESQEGKRFTFGLTQKLRRRIAIHVGQNHRALTADRELAREFFDNCIVDLQEVYDVAAATYYDLRKNLLT